VCCLPLHCAATSFPGKEAARVSTRKFVHLVLVFRVLPSFFLLSSPRFPLRTMSLSSWSHACNTARNKPQHTLLDAANASCGVTVSWAAAAGTHGNNVRRLRRFA
jgi:hypothetical protein